MWLLALYLLIFGTIIPYLLITASMQHLPPTSVGIIGMTELVLASALRLGAAQRDALAAPDHRRALVLLAGVILAETARTAKAGPAQSRTPEIPPT